MPLTAAERKQRQRDRERENRDIIAGAVQASIEKHENNTQRSARMERALAYADWRDKAFLEGVCTSPARVSERD